MLNSYIFVEFIRIGSTKTVKCSLVGGNTDFFILIFSVDGLDFPL